jgi:hypothetical protein
MNYLIPESITLKDGRVIPWNAFNKEFIRNQLFLVEKESTDNVIALARKSTLVRLMSKD